MDKDIANKEEMHFAADIVALDDQDYSDEIMEETLFEVPENEHEIKTFMHETWKNISMETAVYYWMEDEDYTDDYDNEDNEDYPDEMKDMNIYPDEMEDIDDYPDDMEDIYNYPDEMEDMNDFLDEIWKKTVMETEIYFWPIDFGSVTSLPTLETIPEEDEEEDGFEDYNEDSQDIGHCEMDTDTDIKSGYDNISDWKKTVTETEIYFWPIDFGKYKFRPTLETIPEEDEEEDGFEGDNGDSQDIGYSEMDTDTESRYDNISEMEDQDYTDDYDTEDNEEYPDEMEDMDNYPDEMEDMDNYPDDLEDIDNYLDEMEDTDDLLDEIEDIDDFLDEIEDMDAFLDEIYSLSRWKKTVMETEIYFWPMDFGKLTSLPALETIPEEDEEEDGFEGYNGDSQDIGHSEMDTDKESGYDNISEWKKTVTETEIYFRPIDFGKLTSLPTLETIPEEDEEEDGFEDYNGDSQDIGHCEMDTDKESGYDNISGWKKTVMETEIYFWPIDFGSVTSLPTLETIPEEDEEEDGFEGDNRDSQDIGHCEMDTDKESGYDNISEWKKTVMETEIYFWPIDFGKYKFSPTLETIPEEDEEEDGFEDYNGDSQDIGYSEMDTDKESGYDNISDANNYYSRLCNYPDKMEDISNYPDEMEDIYNYPDEIEDMDNYPDEMEDMDDFLDEIWKKTVTETEIYFRPIDFGKLTSLPTLETILEEDEEEDGFEDYNGDSQDIGYSEMDTDIESGYDNISEWKKTVMETEIYFWPIDFGKYKFSPTLETIPEEDEEEDEFEDYNRDSQDIGYSEMDTDTESGYDNISEMEDQDYMDDNDTEDNEEYPDEMEDMDNYPDEMEDIDDYPDDMEDIDNYPDEMKDMDDFLDEIWKKTVMNTEIYFWPIDFGKLTLLPTLETIPEEDEEEDGFEDYNGDSQDIGHCEMDTDKESGYDNISGANNYYSRLCNYPDKMEDISNYPDEMEDIYNYPDEVEDMDNYPDEMEDMDDFLDEIWKKTVTETEIYFRPIDFGDFTFRTTLETILEEEEKVIEEGDEERQNMGRVKMKTQADKDELENASRSYRQWRRLLRFFRETFSCCCSIQTSE
ncbi:uncharacterized protein ACNLHF_007912 [Anomaloglossus baeobatrachus]